MHDGQLDNDISRRNKSRLHASCQTKISGHRFTLYSYLILSICDRRPYHKITQGQIHREDNKRKQQI